MHKSIIQKFCFHTLLSLIKKNFMLQKRNKGGFTLIELLVVIAIIAVLAGIVIQSLTSTRMRARNTERLSSVDQINKALELYATGGVATQLPTSFEYVCLGLKGDTSPTCGGTFNPTNTLVSTDVATNLAGGVTPRDPEFLNDIGTAYLYRSNTPDITTGSCTAVTCPAGAYLFWVTEGSAVCGRGVFWQTTTNGYECVLRIGNAV